MAKITLPEITAGYNSATQLNNAFALLAAELQGKVLYRDNPAGEPNTLENEIDMNTNDINNVGNIDTDTITVAGVDLTTKVGEAATSAANAATSETNAASSAAAALASELAAAGYLDSFDDKYLGAKSSAPTLDNDGNALTDGALYFDTVLNRMYVYDLGTTAWLATSLTTAEAADATTVADNIADVSAVAAIDSDVSLVAAVDSDVTTVAGISTDVSTVSGISTDVTTVSGISSDVVLVAPEATNIGTVASSIGNVNSVGSNIANVITVAGIDTEVTQVATDSTEITSVAGSLTNVNTVASNLTNINTVATNNTNVAAVGSNIASVNTVATNISDVVTFSDLYRGAYATAPAGTTTGSLYYNTTLDQLYVWNGSAWNEAAFSVTGAVTSFNSRTGAVTLSNTDVYNALGFEPGDVLGTIAQQDADNIAITGGTITGMPAPTAGTDVANKNYVDAAITGIHWKNAVNLFADSNLALSGTTNTLVIDGHAALVVGDDGYRLLLTGQTTDSENGLYIYNDDGANYTLTRSTDGDTYTELQGASVFVLEGTTYSNTGWVQENYSTTDFTNQNWVQFSGVGSYTGSNGIQLIANDFSLTNTTVTANSYGSASETLTATVDSKGRLTALADTPISITKSQVSDLGEVVNKTSATGAAVLPSGTEAERDGSPAIGYLRFNSDSASFEGYDGTAWGSIGGGASAGGAIYENADSITANYTIASGVNGHSVGPITLDSGVTVTVSSGQRWVIV